MADRQIKAHALVALAQKLTSRSLTYGEIMGAFGVSRRTAERMVQNVDELFGPLEEGTRGGLKTFRLRGALQHQLINVGGPHLHAIEEASALARSQGLDELAFSLEDLQETLVVALRKDVATSALSRAQGLAELSGYAVRPGPRPEVDGDVFGELVEATLERQAVIIEYRAVGTGNTSRQPVNPYGFVYGPWHYLVAWSENEWAEDFRLFRLDRIQAVRRTGLAFERDITFSLRNYIAQSFSVFQEEPMRVRLLFSEEVAEDVLAYHFHDTQRVQKLEDGSVQVRFTAGGQWSICWELFKWGSNLLEVRPRKLADQYHQMLTDAMPESTT